MVSKECEARVVNSRFGRLAAAYACGCSMFLVALAALSGTAHAQNSAPSITSPSTFSAVEGDTAVATLTATDADSDPLTWTLAAAPGADGARFSLSDSGELAFFAAPDYEHPDDADADRVYEVNVAVTDAVATTTQDLMVTVTDVAPGLTGPATASHAEGKRGLRIAAYTVNDDVVWSLTGADSALFTIDGGFLRFVNPPDFENEADANTDNVYNVSVQAGDGTATETTAVAVTVTDVDEPGTVTLSSPKPKLDTALTATLADPDTVSGTPTWQWERANGREGWEAIDGATAASYTPTSAEADRYLRATATYTDGLGADKTAQATAPHVVIAHRLSALTVPGLSGVPSDDRAFYPTFDPDTLHYAARCTESVTLTLTTEDDDTRLSVNGVQRPKGEAFTVDALGRESDIRITLTGSEGTSTTYTVHCIDREQFPKLTTVKADGATEDLMMFRAKWFPSGLGWRSSLIMMDNNGVPRLRKWIADNVYEYFRVFPDETHPRARYAFTKYGTSYNPDGVELVVLDKYFNTVDDDIHVLSPFNNTDGHDQIILPNGDYVLMAYSRQRRNLRFLNTAFPALRDSGGGPLRTEEVMDSAIQVRTADGTVKLNWNSWDHMAIEDCVLGSTFDDEYGHINALGLIDGDIIAGFRACSKILRIDMDTGDVVWRSDPCRPSCSSNAVRKVRIRSGWRRRSSNRSCAVPGAFDPEAPRASLWDPDREGAGCWGQPPCWTGCRAYGEYSCAVHPGVAEGGIVMSVRDAFERILASLYEAMLDDRHWPATSALIDEACGITGNALMVGEGPKEDIRALFVGLYYRGQRRTDLEREYLEVYHPIDERIPRVRQLPDSRLVHNRDLYTAEELKTSLAYNEGLLRGKHQDSLNVRLDGPDGSYITWGLGDPVASEGWGSSEITMVKRLLPHIRQFVRVRQALVRAKARDTTVTALLDNSRIGVLHLDRRGRILAANDRARSILQHGDRLSDREGVLRASTPDDQLRLERLVAAALPGSGAVAVSGSMLLRSWFRLPPLVLHVKPVGVPQPDYGARHVAALILLVEPGHRHRIDPGLVATTLGLTPGETRVAVWLAEGKSVHEMAQATGHTRDAIYWHLKQIYQKQAISRQADLVRLVLSIAELE